MLVRIKEQVVDSESRYIVDREDQRVTQGYQNGGYTSAGAQMSQRYHSDRSVDGDSRDLKNMGYSIYSGNNRNNTETIPMQNVRSNMMKYEEGVIPLAEEEDDR